MRKIEREELLGLAEYEQVRPQFRNRIISLKKHRRISVGPSMTFVFENRDTMMLQVQEMLRTERITSEPGIQHELSTYNDLIPESGQLSATLFIEIDDKSERASMLAQLGDLSNHIQLRTASAAESGSPATQGKGLIAKARFRPNDGEEEGRLPAVNYLVFDISSEFEAELKNPDNTVTLEVNHPAYRANENLLPGLRDQLAADLAS